MTLKSRPLRIVMYEKYQEWVKSAEKKYDQEPPRVKLLVDREEYINADVKAQWLCYLEERIHQRMSQSLRGLDERL